MLEGEENEDLARLKSSWMIGEDCDETRLLVWLRPEDHQLRLENFYAPSFPQMGHWNSVLCSRLNLDSTIARCQMHTHPPDNFF